MRCTCIFTCKPCPAAACSLFHTSHAFLNGTVVGPDGVLARWPSEFSCCSPTVQVCKVGLKWPADLAVWAAAVFVVSYNLQWIREGCKSLGRPTNNPKNIGLYVQTRPGFHFSISRTRYMTMLRVPLSPWHEAFLSRVWTRRPPDMRAAKNILNKESLTADKG